MDEVIGGSSGAAASSRSAWHGRSDRDVLAAVAQDPRAFAELYLRHGGAIYRYLRSRGSGAQDALDLLAETFATALARIDGYDPSLGEPVSWLFGIARNLYRQSHRTARLVDEMRVRLDVRTERLGPDAAARVDELVDLERVHADIEAKMRGLPAEVAVAVDLRFGEDLRYVEIAERLGITPDAARKRVERGMSRLARGGVANPFRVEL